MAGRWRCSQVFNSTKLFRSRAESHPPRQAVPTRSFWTKQRSDHVHSLFFSSPDFESKIENVEHASPQRMSSVSGGKKKKTSAHRRRSTSKSSNRGTSSRHGDDVQFTRHGRLWCDSSQLCLSLLLEPQLLSFDQRANQEAWPCRRLQEIDYSCWRSRAR